MEVRFEFEALAFLCKNRFYLSEPGREACTVRVSLGNTRQPSSHVVLVVSVTDSEHA